MLKALIIMPNEKTSDVGTLLAIARDAARRREETQTNPTILALHFIPELGIFTAIYDAIEKNHSKSGIQKVS
jgi:hypothetical protein